MPEAILLLVLAVCGGTISLHFTLAYYRLIRPDAAVLPAVCRMDEDTCGTVLRTPQSHVFVLPNSLFGLVFYLLVGAVSAARLVSGHWVLLVPISATAAFAAVFSLYLAWTLIFRLKTPCPLCFTSHALNIASAVILLVALVRR